MWSADVVIQWLNEQGMNNPYSLHTKVFNRGRPCAELLEDGCDMLRALVQTAAGTPSCKRSYSQSGVR